MLRGLYTATSGMIAQQRKHDTATSNIANVNTPGYKAVNTVTRSFPEMLIGIIRDEDAKGPKGSIGSLHTGVFAEESLPQFLQGDLTPTDNPTDLAIVSNLQVPGLEFDASGKAVTPDGQVVFQPQAFFTVRSVDGEERYTRNGKFMVNDAGEWVTSSGHRLLGADGEPIRLDMQPNQIQITPNGRLIDPLTGAPILTAEGEEMRLMISIVDDPYALRRAGDGNFLLDEGAAAPRVMAADEQVQVMQGYVERSNVDPTQATVDMMTALRAYEANQQVIQLYDRSLEKAANEVGRV